MSCLWFLARNCPCHPVHNLHFKLNFFGPFKFKENFPDDEITAVFCAFLLDFTVYYILTTVLRERFLDFTYSRMGHVSRSRYFALASFMLVFGLLHASICLVSIYLL